VWLRSRRANPEQEDRAWLPALLRAISTRPTQLLTSDRVGGESIDLRFQPLDFSLLRLKLLLRRLDCFNQQGGKPGVRFISIVGWNSNAYGSVLSDVDP
jgi:hypothetical protein